MTKPWEEYREEICRLYSNGTSLERIRAKLAHEKKLTASTRAYREKLRGWNVTRARQLEGLKAESVNRSRREAAPNIRISTVASEGDTTSRFGSEALISPVSSETVRSSRSPDASLSYHNTGYTTQNLSPALTAATLSASGSVHSPAEHERRVSYDLPASPVSSELWSSEIDEAKYKWKVARILKDAQFAEGTDTVLHEAAIANKSWAIDHITDFMRSRNLSLDIANAQGMTALELAMLGAQSAAVDALLRAGASVTRRNQKSLQPLHLAVLRSSAHICRLLLEYGANPNASDHEESFGHTPLRLAVGSALSSETSLRKDEACAIVEVLLDHQAHMDLNEDDSNDGTAVLRFLMEWMQWDRRLQTGHRSGRFRLGHYLRSGCDPLCWFPSSYCIECDSLASFVFAHTNRGLAVLLIQGSDMEKYGRQLARRIVSPCKRSRSHSADLSLSYLLYILLQTTGEQGFTNLIDGDLVYEVLKKSPEHDKVALLETLLKHIRFSNHDREHILLGLVHMDEMTQLRLSEILLWPDMGLVNGKLYNDIARHYLGRFDYSAGLGRPTRELYPGFTTKTIIDLGFQVERLSVVDVESIMRCIIHVLTRSLLEECSHGLPLTEDDCDRVQRLRKLYDLPGLNISVKSAYKTLLLDKRVPGGWDVGRGRKRTYSPSARRNSDSSVDAHMVDNLDARPRDVLREEGNETFFTPAPTPLAHS